MTESAHAPENSEKTLGSGQALKPVKPAAQVNPEISEGAEKVPLWREIFSVRMGQCLVLGFSSGLPLYVLSSLLVAWLRKEGIDLKVIGFFSLVMFPYTWKFLWAPLLDRFSPLKLGRRRGWMLLTQLALLVALAATGFVEPAQSLQAVVALSVLTALASATQDIAIDAYRRELLSDHELGLGNSLFVNAYRVSSLIPAGLSLILADLLPWNWVFLITAAFMLPGIGCTLLIREPPAGRAPRSLRAAVVEPWQEFLRRRGISHALVVLLFVFLYKIGDSMCTALATPFYIDLGYELTTIGLVAKNVGLWSMVAGGLLGGIWMLRLGINRALWLFGVAQLLPIAGFALLAHEGAGGTPAVFFLALVIGAEALGTGLGTAAFVSFIAAQTDKAFTATQFALLTSLAAVPRTVCNATTGYLVEALGWENFYWLCMSLGVPGMLLLLKIAPWRAAQPDQCAS